MKIIIYLFPNLLQFFLIKIDIFFSTTRTHTIEVLLLEHHVHLGCTDVTEALAIHWDCDAARDDSSGTLQLWRTKKQLP